MLILSIGFLEIWGNQCKKIQFLASKAITLIANNNNTSRFLLHTYNASYCAKRFTGITCSAVSKKYHKWPLFLGFCTEVLHGPH